MVHLKEKALFNQPACGACYNGFTPEVEDITLAGPRLRYRATELLLPVLDVRLPVEDLDEVEVAVVGLLEKIKLDAPLFIIPLQINGSLGSISIYPLNHCSWVVLISRISYKSLNIANI